jgi:hypothetical protein
MLEHFRGRVLVALGGVWLLCLGSMGCQVQLSYSIMGGPLAGSGTIGTIDTPGQPEAKPVTWEAVSDVTRTSYQSPGPEKPVPQPTTPSVSVMPPELLSVSVGKPVTGEAVRDATPKSSQVPADAEKPVPQPTLPPVSVMPPELQPVDVAKPANGEAVHDATPTSSQVPGQLEKPVPQRPLPPVSVLPELESVDLDGPHLKSPSPGAPTALPAATQAAASGNTSAAPPPPHAPATKTEMRSEPAAGAPVAAETTRVAATEAAMPEAPKPGPGAPGRPAL